MSASVGFARVALAASLLAGVAAAVALAPGAAQARGGVVLGIGIGPLFPVYRPYYPPPPAVVYTPPPAVVYAPPPAVAYAPPPPPGLSANQAGPTYTAPNGQLCREYQTTLRIGGQVRPAYGTACLMPDGAWRVVN